MRAARVDLTQRAIVAALREVGASVLHLHSIGRNAPDILCGYKSENYLMELKTGKAKPTEGQSKWHSEWRGNVFVVRTPEEALDAIGVTK